MSWILPSEATTSIARAVRLDAMSSKRHNQDRFAEKENASYFHGGMVHAVVSIKEATIDTKCKAARYTEWNKLNRLPAWDIKKVKPKTEVFNNARQNNVPVLFASSMT